MVFRQPNCFKAVNRIVLGFVLCFGFRAARANQTTPYPPFSSKIRPARFSSLPNCPHGAVVCFGFCAYRAHPVRFSAEFPFSVLHCSFHQSAYGRHGQPQPHVHLMYSERINDGIERNPEQYFKRYNAKHPERGGAKKHNIQGTQTERKEALKALRNRWEQMHNAHIDRRLPKNTLLNASRNHRAKISMKSLAEQGITDRKPEPHMVQGIGNVTRNLENMRDSLHTRAFLTHFGIMALIIAAFIGFMFWYIPGLDEIEQRRTDVEILNETVKLLDEAIARKQGISELQISNCKGQVCVKVDTKQCGFSVKGSRGNGSYCIVNRK